MSKKISEMSLKELWELFPIILVEHQDYWTEWYEEEILFLSTSLPKEQIVRINHIGSTAIKGIWAKPIVDILMEIKTDSNIEQVKDILISNGYICMSQNEHRMSFNKGYTESGFSEKVFHLHLRYLGDNDELYFRDYLNININTAREYETLKLKLWEKYKYDRDEYTKQKTRFVTEYTKLAKTLFKYVSYQRARRIDAESIK